MSFERCPECNGCGLIKKTPFKCQHCNSLTILNRMYCENINKSCYDECLRCRGVGLDKYKIMNNIIECKQLLKKKPIKQHNLHIYGQK